VADGAMAPVYITGLLGEGGVREVPEKGKWTF
jgi:hypothetical protein